MQSNWTSDFLRETFLNSDRGNSISHWAGKLIEALREAKPDHELHVFGVSRIPRTPNFLLGSSSEAYVSDGPLVVNVTPKTAELFLAPTKPGVRMLSEELPMLVRYDLDHSDRRIDLSFYEAICFDAEHSSIILGLTLSEISVGEFLTSDELADLLPIVRSLAVPLLENEQLRSKAARMEDDMQAMTTVMRESNPELSKLSSVSFLPQSSSESSHGPWDAEFLQYCMSELKRTLDNVVRINGQQLEMSRTSLGSPQLHQMAVRVSNATESHQTIMKNVMSLAALSGRDVKPRQGAFPMQSLIQELYGVAVSVAEPFDTRVELDERTRNIYVNGDQATLLGMLERLIRNCAENARGGTIWIKSEDSADIAPEGMVLLEIRDDGKVNEEVPAYKLMDRVSLHHLDHPRLRNGGGVLYQLLDLFLAKSGGKFALRYGVNGEMCVQLMLPLVSRSELERIKAGEIG